MPSHYPELYCCNHVHTSSSSFSSKGKDKDIDLTPCPPCLQAFERKAIARLTSVYGHAIAGYERRIADADKVLREQYKVGTKAAVNEYLVEARVEWIRKKREAEEKMPVMVEGIRWGVEALGGKE